MRLIVACQACKRQFDASRQPIGQRFRCVCSEVVVVEEPKSHDSAVVRCSSCGAARQRGEHACSHCSSDFTLHERDLHTVCPGCFTRISDNARFCHHCAQPMAVDSVVGDETNYGCPACGEEHHLHSRSFGEKLSVLECGRCAGMWLGSDTFEHVVSRAEDESFTVDGHGKPEREQIETLAQQSGPAYRPCIQCAGLMQRKNYGKRSNVIIDVCKTHGVWFDAHELSRILEWVRAGGLEVTRKLEKDRLREEERRANSRRGRSSLMTPQSSEPTFSFSDSFSDGSKDTGTILRGFLSLFLKN